MSSHETGEHSRADRVDGSGVRRGALAFFDRDCSLDIDDDPRPVFDHVVVHDAT